MESLKSSRRWKVIKTLLGTVIGLTVIVLGSMIYGISIQPFVAYYGSYLAMTSAVIVGHFVSKPSE